MALIINIDSTLETASVSIAENGNILQSVTNTVQKEHAAFIHVSIKKLLTELKISIKNIDAIATTIGPGSYTGLRVCLAAAKGLSYALNKPLITIGTLEAMAKATFLNVKNNNDYFYCPMIDARRMEVYTALYNENLVEIIAPHAVIINEVFCASFLEKQQVLFFGSGMEKFKYLNISTNAVFEKMPPITTAINLLSYDKFYGEIFADVATSSPLYTKEFYNL